MKKKVKNPEEVLEGMELKNGLIELEQFWVNGTLDNVDELVNKRKEEITGLLQGYEKIMTVEVKDEETGEVIDTYEKKYNPYLVSTYFFKSINPLTSIEPEYSSEKLALVWDLYMYLIEQVNINIAPFQPTISHFCKFAGITTYTLKNYKSSMDSQMRVVVNKIFDETFDSNMFLAQTRTVANKPTEMRVRVENEVQEKPQVKVNVNVGAEIDMKQIASRLDEIANFRKVKEDENVIEVDIDE